MNRPIKFRAWDKERNRMAEAFDLSSNPRVWWKRANRDFPLMQFTGLTDKNGKEIYEGDITEYEEGPDDVGAYNTVRRVVEFMPDGYWMHATGEVIGNIYENSDLLV